MCQQRRQLGPVGTRSPLDRHRCNCAVHVHGKVAERVSDSVVLTTAVTAAAGTAAAAAASGVVVVKGKERGRRRGPLSLLGAAVLEHVQNMCSSA